MFLSDEAVRDASLITSKVWGDDNLLIVIASGMESLKPLLIKVAYENRKKALEAIARGDSHTYYNLITK